MRNNEVPVGAVIVHDDKIISAGVNQILTSKDPTGHAELICIRRACRKLGSERLPDSTLVTTLEPCTMCMGAAVLARVKTIIYLAPDKKLPAASTLVQLEGFNHYPKLIFQEEYQGASAELLTGFFRKRRKV